MAASTSANADNNVKKIYQTVIDEVLTNVREAFLDEGYDEQLLQELKQMWETKLNASRAIQASEVTHNAVQTQAAAHRSGSGNAPRLPVTQSDKNTTHLHHHHYQEQQTQQQPHVQDIQQHHSQQQHHHHQQPQQSNPQQQHHHHHQQPQQPHLQLLQHQQMFQQQHYGHNVAASANNSRILDVKQHMHMLDPTRAAIQVLPPALYAAAMAGAHSAAANANKSMASGSQLDGGMDGSSSDEEDDEEEIGDVSDHVAEEDADEDTDDKANHDDHSEYEGKEDPEPLNSADDLTEPGSPDSSSDLFDTEHVIVCQYDKITRIKNKWKFHLKDGIMNINGKDYLFSKANGDAEW